MSVMSEAHQDLESIHNILLGQRKVQDAIVWDVKMDELQRCLAAAKVTCINDLLLEFEAAGIVFPTNVVEGDFTKCWPKEL